jgi:4-amino-4-deoxy-L-arabinose transferase-like glycosyltransferase
MQSRLLLLLLRPSLFSLVTVICLTLGILLWNNWSYFTYNDALYSTLYGEFGAITALERSPSLIQGVIDGLSTSPILYTLVVILAAAIAGWLAFLVIKVIRSGRELTESTFQQHSAWQRLGMRILVALLWVLYSIVTLYYVIPFCLLLSRIGAETIATPQGIGLNIGALALLVFALHIHIIFLRLFLLRPRVFGGAIDIEEAAFPIHALKK